MTDIMDSLGKDLWSENKSKFFIQQDAQAAYKELEKRGATDLIDILGLREPLGKMW